MKKTIISLFLFIGLICLVQSQKIGYVSTEIIINKMPEYSIAQGKIKSLSNQWAQELKTKRKELGELKEAFENEKVLLTENQKADKQLMIDELQKQTDMLLQSKFGPSGELMKLQESMFKPIQDKIWDAVAAVSTKNNVGMMFDKSNKELLLIFSDIKFDYTDKVLKELKIEK